MKIDLTRIELTIDEAINEFGFPSDIGKFGNKVICSHEFVMDFNLYFSSIYKIRSSPEFSADELQGYADMEKYLDELDMNAARARVEFPDRNTDWYYE